MKAKAYLLKVKKLNILIKQKQSELDNLTLVKTIDYSDVRVQQSTDYEESVLKLLKKVNSLEHSINDDLFIYIKERDLIVRQIQSLGDSRYVDVLYKRYIEFKRYEKIADEMFYDFVYVKGLHKKALESFEKKYKKFLKNT